MLDLLNFDAVVIVVGITYVFSFYFCIHLSSPGNLNFMLSVEFFRV